MSLNYRKRRARNQSESIRRMILIMFQIDLPYFPTLREIRDEIIKAQLHEINVNSIERSFRPTSLFGLLKESYKEKWNMLFELANLGDMDKPLTPKILSDP